MANLANVANLANGFDPVATGYSGYSGYSLIYQPKPAPALMQQAQAAIVFEVRAGQQGPTRGHVATPGDSGDKGAVLVLLLCGSDKADQDRAIGQAIQYLDDWKQRGRI